MRVFFGFGFGFGLLLAVSGFSMPSFAAPPTNGLPSADWIWSDAETRMVESGLMLRKSFELRGAIQHATIRVVADFAKVKLQINGKPAIQSVAFDPLVEADVKSLLLDGTNSIDVSASGVIGPSAIAFVLSVVLTSGEDVTIASDTSVQSGEGAKITSLGKVESHRWQKEHVPDISPFAEYNQWKEALGGDGKKVGSEGAARLSPLPPGFEIVKIRDALDAEGSWISMTIDPRGRLIVAQEQKGLLRLTLSDDRNQVAHAETIDTTLGECRGLLWHGDALYAHANRDNALLRLRDTNGDDHFDEVTKLLSTKGGTGHGRNDLVTGPDGAIHAIVGDDVQVPDASPRRARPEAAATKELGHWARVVQTEDGVSWEAMNRGLRNPYGIDFNTDGEAFTYDADNEGDVGLPFYRPTRINHLVSGANYGWHQDRDQTRSLPVYAPDSVPTTLDLGRGSPTSIKFGTLSHFPSPWKDALFVLDWAYGRIIAVHLTPNGASYGGHGELFMEGRPLNVTDLDFDSDGSMWFITGGRKTKSALYRIRYTGEPAEAAAPLTVQSESRIEFSKQARQLRQRLERFHSRTDAAAVGQVWPHLNAADPWIRSAARVALEWQPVDQWRALALAAKGDLAGLTSLLALARAGTDNDRTEIALRLSMFEPPSDWGDIEKLTFLRCAELTDRPNDPATRSRCVAQAITLAADASGPVSSEVARRLVALDTPHAIAFGLERMALANDQLERLHYLEVLSEARVGWTRKQRRLFFTSLAYAKRFSYGDRFMPAFFEAVQTAALANVLDNDERTELGNILVQDQAVAATTQSPRPFVRQWSVSDVLSADKSQDAGTSQPLAEPDVQRGRQLFATAMCANCHVCGVEGRPVGPDLTTVGRRFSRREVLESIIEPSKVIADAFRDVVILRNDGTITTGRIVQNDFRESKLILAIGDLTSSRLQTIPKAEIESWSESPISSMPTGLLDALTRQEINDLLAFLLAEGLVD